MIFWGFFFSLVQERRGQLKHVDSITHTHTCQSVRVFVRKEGYVHLNVQDFPPPLLLHDASLQLVPGPLTQTAGEPHN